MVHIHPDAFITSVRAALPLAAAFFMGGSLLIHEIGDHVSPTKEIFYSWLLVFFNAYIGIFIANKALKRKSGGFFAWALLGNGIRDGIFLILLFCFLEWEILNARGFVLKTFFGYFTFLAVVIYGLQNHMQRLSENPPGDKKDE